VGCGKQSKSSESTKTDTVVIVEEVMVQTGNTEGAYFTDITGVTPEGTELSLNDLVGATDYVLVDFWASWCGPCRRFIPVLKEIYSSMPEGRLQIISCSVDQEEAAWRTALREEQMPWPQMREDETHSCSDVYNVQFIPHTVLIDREGTIVGVNLEEPEIQEILLGE
jgi:thiol-disulfide isomerase/thioredoxin